MSIAVSLSSSREASVAFRSMSSRVSTPACREQGDVKPRVFLSTTSLFLLLQPSYATQKCTYKLLSCSQVDKSIYIVDLILRGARARTTILSSHYNHKNGFKHLYSKFNNYNCRARSVFLTGGDVRRRCRVPAGRAPVSGGPRHRSLPATAPPRRARAP